MLSNILFDCQLKYSNQTGYGRMTNDGLDCSEYDKVRRIPPGMRVGCPSNRLIVINDPVTSELLSLSAVIPA